MTVVHAAMMDPEGSGVTARKNWRLCRERRARGPGAGI